MADKETLKKMDLKPISEPRVAYITKGGSVIQKTPPLLKSTTSSEKSSVSVMPKPTGNSVQPKLANPSLKNNVSVVHKPIGKVPSLHSHIPANLPSGAQKSNSAHTQMFVPSNVAASTSQKSQSNGDLLTSVLSSVGISGQNLAAFSGQPNMLHNQLNPAAFPMMPHGLSLQEMLILQQALHPAYFASMNPYMMPQFAAANFASQRPTQSMPVHDKPEVDPVDLLIEDDGGLVHAAETYDQYVPSKLALGLPHPDPIVETMSLASASPPDISYQLRMPEHIGDDGLLSSLQLEAIVYACQRHQVFLGDGSRAGYLIGDGAGVGKGRTIAGIIYENWFHGRKKAIWLSVSNDLKYDAERDLEDISAQDIEVHSLNKMKYAKLNGPENGNVKKGVLFATYSCLIGESQGGRSEYGTRMKQVINWCGKNFDGVLVFDECHRAKNLCPAMGTKPTKTGLAVLEIQRLLPQARIIYASATGASEPRNMAYMTRLGLWGSGTPFKDFFEFTSSIDKRGVGAMELIAMDMKLRGMYIARQLSFAGVSFDIRQVPVEKDYQVLYDDCVELWTFAREKFAQAADLFQADQRLLKQMWGQFWGSHQRFFKYLCLSCKVDYVVKLAKDAVKDGKCAVIGLQSTGEARTLEQLEESRGVLTEFVSTAKAVFQSLVDKHFPAYDRRKVFELVGLTDMLEDEAEAMLDEEPDAAGNIKKRRPNRKGRTVVDSYRIPTVSDLDTTDEDSGKEAKAATSRSTRTSNRKRPNAKRQRGRPSKKKMKKTNVESDEDSNFEPTDSDSSSASESNGSDDNASHDASGSGSESSDVFSDEDNPWVKLLEAKRQARKRHMKSDAAVQDESSCASENVVKSPKELMDEAQALKDELLDRFQQLAPRLPNNTLDDLLDKLGGVDQVAEMTGRKGRVVTTSTGSVLYEARNDCDVALELLNLTEKQRFMDGEKLIAIISEAASSGISLQADRRAKNTRRRVHITLELSWSADKAIQQFGRTHRSNQVSAPEYIFLITDLAGEKRFASAVARRLESLGALTHGDRRATDSRDLSMFNIDTKYGRAAVEDVLKIVAGYERPNDLIPTSYSGDFLMDARQAMKNVGMLIKSRVGNSYNIDRDCFNMGKFLNRLLGMPVQLQNHVFEFFSRTMDHLIDTAKREGRFDMGILELGFGSTDVVQEKKLEFRGPSGWTNVPTYLYTVSVERGLSWEDAVELLNEFDDNTSGFYLSRNMMAGKHTISLAVLKSGQRVASVAKERRLYCVYRPYSGMQLRFDTFEEIRRKGKLISLDEAMPVWKEMYESMSRRCLHAYWNGNCKNAKSGSICDVGLRRRTYTILSGSVLSAWQEIGEVLYRNERFKKTQNVRVRFQNNSRIVGIIIPNAQVQELVNLLTTRGFSKKEDALMSVEHLSDDSDADD